MPPLATALLAWPVGLATITALGWTAWLLARRALPGARTSVRATAAFVLVHAQLLAWFELLGAARAFRLPVVVAAVVGAAVLAHRRLEGAVARQEARALAAELRVAAAELGPWARWPAWGAAALALAKVLRSAVAPSLATDSTLYHVVRAKLWVERGGFAYLRAPDMWRVYDRFPPGGDVPWTWAVLVGANEAWVGAFSVATWLACGVACWALVRELGAGRRVAAASAWLLAFTPAVAQYAGTAYVDDAVAAFFAAGTALLVHLASAPGGPAALVASLAFALAAQAKLSAVPLLALATLFAAWACRPSRSGARIAPLAAGWLAGALVVAPHVARTWLDTGSPIYPFELRLGGRTIFAGDDLWTMLADGRFAPGLEEDYPYFLRVLFAPRFDGRADTTGFGPAFFAIAALAVVALATKWARRRGERWIAAWLAIVAAAFLGSIWGRATLAYRTEWAPHTPRYLLPAIVALVALGAPLGGRRAQAVRAVAVAASFACAVPTGWGRVDAAAVGSAATAFALALAPAFLLARRPGRARLALVAALAATWAAWIATLAVRREHRSEYLAALEARSIWDIHRTGFIASGTRRIWSILDDHAPLRVAVAAGWNGNGMHWFLTPLAGAELANELVYVPPTADGRVVDYRSFAELSRQVDYDAWRRRLLEQRVDVVATLSPEPLERWWLEQHPDDFAKLAQSDDGSAALHLVIRPGDAASGAAAR